MSSRAAQGWINVTSSDVGLSHLTLVEFVLKGLVNLMKGYIVRMRFQAAS